MAFIPAPVKDVWTWANAKLSDAESYVVAEWMRGWTPVDMTDLTDKVALVTGATSGIGFEVARKMAENGAKVYMVGRLQAKLNNAATRIRTSVGKGAKLETMQCDLCDLSDVLQLTKTFKATGDPLHILVNMAGTLFPGSRSIVKGNCEQTMATNFLAPALLTLGLLDAIPAGGRIIMMSSEIEALARIDLSDIKGEKCKASGLNVHAASKLYLIMWARELSARLRDKKAVDIFCVHPGLVATPGVDKMDREHYAASWMMAGITKVFGQRPYHGAFSTLYAATAPELRGKGYAYIGPNMLGLYHNVERTPASRAARNPVTCWQLFEAANKALTEVVGAANMPPIPEHPADAAWAKKSVATVRQPHSIASK